MYTGIEHNNVDLGVWYSCQWQWDIKFDTHSGAW